MSNLFPGRMFDGQLWIPAAEVSALAARLAEAERDAARYRWLRDDMARIDPVLSVVAKVHHDRRCGEWCNVHDLDATVDLVRAASSASGAPE